MSNKYFQFKHFTIYQEHAVFKITTDSVLLGAWAELEDSKHILDVGTGTGILALMAAQRCNAEIVAIEPDRNSFMQAGINIANSPWHDRIKVVNSTLQTYSPGEDVRFDTIITNPPYFIDSLPNPDNSKAMARHALALGHDELIENAIRLTTPSGTLQLVLPVSEAERFTGIAAEKAFFCQRKLNVKATPSLPVSRVLMTFGRHRSVTEEKTIVIEEGGRHRYSDEYISLTKDFYLKF